MKTRRNLFIALIMVVLIIAAGIFVLKDRLWTKSNQTDTVLTGSAEEKITLPASKVGDNWRSIGKTDKLSYYNYIIAENDHFILCMKDNGEIGVWDKTANYLYASNPIDKEEDQLAKAMNKMALGSQAVVEFIDQGGGTSFANTLGGAVNSGNISYEPTENGIKFWYYFDSANVAVALNYTLEEDGLRVQVPFQDFKESGNGVMSISLLPYFGAAGLKDEGYIFVPDGCGALMYDNNNKASYQPYSQEVYSREPSLYLERNTDIGKSIRMPVFGAKTGDSGYLAVITEGEASASINAMTSGAITSYNNVYPKFIYRQVAQAVTEVSNRYGSAKAIAANVVTKVFPKNDKFEVKYYLLHKADLSYVDMAECYRNYLIENKGLEKKASVTTSLLYLDLYGGLKMDAYMLGIKYKAVHKLTTYQEAKDILRQLLDKGVDQIAFKYTGWQKGGIESEILTKPEFEGALGGYDDYKDLTDFIKEKGIEFFPDIDLLNFYKSGNGMTLLGDTAQSIIQTPAFQYQYDLDTLKNVMNGTGEVRKWRLLTPTKTYQAFEELTKNYDKLLVDNISLTSMGNMVYSDFSQKANGYHRDDTRKLWETILKEAKEQFSNVMVDGGNAYAAIDASHIFGVTSQSTQYDMEDETVPFYQIVFHGYTSYSTEPINLSADPQAELLKALETGSNLGYTLMAGDPFEIVKTKYNFIFTGSAEDWLDTVAAQYKIAAPVLQAVSDKVIIDHTMLQKKVYKTVFEDGSTIYVNYGKNPVTVDGQQINAKNFVFIKGTSN
ncbi:MAG TPA: DUF5696 domain-containing protein [Mobilitalea sp.]|nr:DUF5696 domain-containing protein [Mobilitalea sp.]